MTLRLLIKALLCLLSVASISAQLGFAVGASINASVPQPCANPYKVALDSATLWGSGNNTHSEMLDSASKQGFDAVFFADDQHFLDNVGIRDPGFENVTASGGLANWANFTSGNPLVGVARVNRTLTRAGSSSLELALESSPHADEFVYPIWGRQSHRLHLFGNVQLKWSVNVPNVTLGRKVVNLTRCFYVHKYCVRYYTVPTILNIDWSEAQVYSKVTLRLSPRSNSKATIFFIYDYRYPVKATPTGENSTSTYYFYMTPPGEGWKDISVNLTHLARELWNQTVVDYGWIESVTVGVMSMGSAYVDALFDDVSITPVDDFESMMQYLRNSILPSVSTDTVKAYSGYTLHGRPSESPSPVSVLGGKAQAEDLEGVTDWNTLLLGARDARSLLVLDSPISNWTARAMNRTKEMKDLSVADLSIDQQLWDDVLSQGRAVVIAASDLSDSEAIFANESTWVNRVCAAANSEQMLLEAIYLGHGYVARNNFNGEFEFDSLGFESSRLPLYVADNGDATLHVKISGVDGGTVHLITKQGREIAAERLPITGSYEKTFTFSFGDDSVYFRAVITNSTGSPVVVSNPIFYIHKPMPPGSYVYISDPVASVQSWNMTEGFTHREVLIGLASGEPMFPVSRNGTAIYLRTATRAARYKIGVGDLTRPADDFYDSQLNGYVVPLTSELPITITLSLDKSVPEALVETGEGVAPALAYAMLPFVIAVAWLGLHALVKRKRQS
jgi:hypothetical protein